MKGAQRKIVGGAGNITHLAMEASSTKAQLANLGIESAELGATVLARYMAEEIPKWERVVKAAKIPPQ